MAGRRLRAASRLFPARNTGPVEGFVPAAPSRWHRRALQLFSRKSILSVAGAAPPALAHRTWCRGRRERPLA